MIIERRFLVIPFTAIGLVAGLWAGPTSKLTYLEHAGRQQNLELSTPGSGGEILNLAYVDEGSTDSPVVLLIHGVPTSSWSYRHLTRELVALGYRVIAPDNLGFGNSSMPEGDENYELRLQALRIFELMDHLGIARWTQVLHDVGGPISWEMLIINPDPIDRLVILNTFAYETGWNPPKSMDSSLMKFAMGVVGFRNRTIIRNTICDMIVVRDQLDNALSLEGYYVPLEHGADRAYLAFMSSFDRVRERLPFYRAALRRSDIPAIIFWGKEDSTLVGSEAIPLFARDLEIPEEDIELRSDAKHLIMEELPEYLAGRIDEFSNR